MKFKLQSLGEKRPVYKDVVAEKAPEPKAFKISYPTMTFNSEQVKNIMNVAPGDKCRVMIDAKVLSGGLGKDKYDSTGKAEGKVKWAELELHTGDVIPVSGKKYRNMDDAAQDAMRESGS